MVTRCKDFFNFKLCFFRNGPGWLRIRTAFQRGLSSPQSVKKFLKSTDEIIHEWLLMINYLRKIPDYDFLPELSRLFLECMLA